MWNMMDLFKTKNPAREPLIVANGSEQTHCKSSNFGSILSAIGQIPGFAGDAYWLALLTDAIFGLEPQLLGVSRAGLIFGCATSLYTTASFIYCDYIMNTNTAASRVNHIETWGNATSSQTHTKQKLSAFQWVMLIGFFIDQVGGKASSLGLVLHIIGTDSLGLTRWKRAAIQSSLAIFGTMTSSAEFVTAKFNLEYSMGKSA